MIQCYSLKPSHPCLLPQSPKVCFLHPCLFRCLAYRVIITIFLNSIYMSYYTVLVFFFLILLCIIGSIFIHLIRTDSNAFFSMAEYILYTYHCFPIHSYADGHLGCCHVLAIVNSAVMNTGVHVFFSVPVSSVCMPSSGVAGSYGS